MGTDDDLTAKTDKDLATFQERCFPNDAKHILAEKEWQRRLMKEQHELNKEIIKSQTKKILISAIITALSGILGVLIGAFLTEYLIEHRPILKPQTSQYTHKGMGEKESPVYLHH